MERPVCFHRLIGLIFIFMTIVPCIYADISQNIDLITPYDGVMRIYGNEPGDYAGLSIASGDINGDGLDDVIVGAVRADPEDRWSAGEVFVVFGNQDMKSRAVTDLSESPDGVLRIQGSLSYAEFGQSLSAGDIDGDGYDDILIGAWLGGLEDRNYAGAAYIVFGSSDIDETGVIDVADFPNNVIAIYGEKPGDELGVSVKVGDINGDGFCDAIIGAWYADPYDRADAGKTYVFFGSEDIRNHQTIDLQEPSIQILTIAGVGYTLDYPDNSGFYVGSGDINGDGFEDVIVGAKFADPNDKPNSGELYIVFGSEDINSQIEIDLAETENRIVRIQGCDPHDYTGSKLNTGDVNGDGYIDVLIDAYSGEAPDRFNPGRTYVVFGSAEIEYGGNIDLSIENLNVLTIYGENSEDHLGKPSAGDINGDGICDLLFQSDCADPDGRTQAGEAYILIGSSDLSSRNIIDLQDSHPDIIRIKGDLAGGYMGFISTSGDIDGDGYYDAIYGAHGSSPENRSGAGIVYVVWGDNFTPEGEDASLIIDAPDYILPGNSFTVDIYAQDIRKLFGISFTLHYTQADYIDVVTTEAGDFLGENIISFFDTDETGGIVSAGLSCKAGNQGVTGTGVVASVRFTVSASIPEGKTITFSPDDIIANDAEGTALILTGVGDVSTVTSKIEVWPGDTNNDGIVNQADILPLGLYWGLTGSARETISTAWTGHTCAPWDPVAATYADANGSGRINQTDVLSIGLNWGSTHSILQDSVLKPVDSPGTVQPISLKETPLSEGEEIYVEIRVDEVQSLMGLSFVLDYNLKDYIELLTVESDSFWGDNAVFFSQIDESSGEVAVGITRKAGEESITGNGTAAGIRFKVLRDVKYGTVITFSLKDVAAINQSGKNIGITAIDGYLGLATGISGQQDVPAEFSLKHNYPNPFNPSTSIEYFIPDGKPGQIRIDVYDLRGGLVKTLVDQTAQPGIHSTVWDGRDEYGNQVSSGIYIYQLRAGEFIKSNKMMLMK